MNWAKKFSWNPLLPKLEEFSFGLCALDTGASGGGGGGTSGGASGGGAPPGGTPAPAGGDGSGSGTGSPGAGDASEGSGADSSPSSSFDGLDNLGDDFDSIDLGDVGEGETPPTEPQQPQGQQPPVAAQTPPAQEKQTPPAPQPPATPASGGQTPQAPRSAREELSDAVDGFKNNFNDLVKWGTTELFTLTPEETDELDTNAVAAIPKLMARTYTQAVMASANIFRNFAQRMIEEGFAAQTERTTRANEAKSAFYKAFPNLNPAQHDATVAQYAKTFRAMNPKASREEAIKFVGAAVLAHHGMQAAPAGGQGGNGRTPPFQPALPGGRAPAVQQPHNPFDGMEDDFDAQ